jgi:hypothetical protein
MTYDDIRNKINDGSYKNKEKYPDSGLRRSNGWMYKTMMIDYRQGNAKVDREFRQDCRSYFEQTIGKKLSDTAWDAIYSKAYDSGHSSGNLEILQELDALVDLISTVLK